MSNPTDEIISTYTSSEAIEDGILMPNPCQNRFSECDLLTTNLWGTIEDVAKKHNTTSTVQLTTEALCGGLMAMARDLYHAGKFEEDQDRNFFTTPKTDGGVTVWFARNENGKLTAMLPEDY